MTTTAKPYIKKLYLMNAEGPLNTATNITIERNHFADDKQPVDLMGTANLLITQWAREEVALNRNGLFKVDLQLAYMDGKALFNTYLMNVEADQHGANLGRWLWRSYACTAGLYKPAEDSVTAWHQWRNYYCDKEKEQSTRDFLAVYGFD